jgi:hypothetical protein
MIRRLLVGVAVAASLALASCGDIPSCGEVSCDPQVEAEFDGILVPQPQAFTPAGDGMPADSTGGAVRG